MFSALVDDDIRLCLVQHSFAPRYTELVAAHSEYLSQWLAWPEKCNTEEAFRAFVTRSLHDYADGKSLTCAIEYRGEIVGNISFNAILDDRKMVEIGYWLAESYQGQGIVTRACRFLINHAFTALDMDKVQISVAEDNKPSRAVCERLGMTLEGIISNREKIGDRILAHAVYGLHRTQIEQAKV
ncbi:GNAT family N-acetyltransferase [Spongorhabdus nitratireducens]